MAIHVEIGEVAVHPLADVVGQPADGQNVRRGVEREAVFGAQALLSQDLGGDWFQTRVICSKGVGPKRVGRTGRFNPGFRCFGLGGKRRHVLMIPKSGCCGSRAEWGAVSKGFVPQGLKPSIILRNLVARVNSCPFKTWPNCNPARVRVRRRWTVGWITFERKPVAYTASSSLKQR